MSGCALVGMAGSDPSSADHLAALPALGDSASPAAAVRQEAEAGRGASAEARPPLPPEVSGGSSEPAKPDEPDEPAEPDEPDEAAEPDEPATPQSTKSSSGSDTPADPSPTDSLNAADVGADARAADVGADPRGSDSEPLVQPWSPSAQGTPWTGGTPGTPWTGETTGTPWTPVEVESSDQPPPREGPVVLYAAGLVDDPDPAVKAAVLGVYLSFWENYWSASTHPVDPKGARLHLYAGEPILSRAKNVLSERAARGLALHFEDSHGEGRLVFIDKWAGGYAEIVDCIVDNASVYDVNTGAVLNDETATVVNRGLIYLTDERWQVSEVFQQAIYEGKEEGCVLQISDGAATPTDQQADQAGQAVQETSRPGNQRS